MCNNKMLSAMTRCLRAYEALIKNPGKHKHKWADYGYVYSCLVCRAVEEDGDRCSSCLISPCASGDAEYSLNALQGALHRGDDAEIKTAAQNRYNDLLGLLEDNGYVYEEEK